MSALRAEDKQGKFVGLISTVKISGDCLQQEYEHFVRRHMRMPPLQDFPPLCAL